MKRGGWRPEILEAVEAVKAAKGVNFERRDVVRELVRKHPDVPNHRIQGAVTDHLVAGPDGQYELRPQSRRWAPRAREPGPVAPSPTNPPALPATNSSHPLLDYIFPCPKCGEALIIGKPECPGTNCKEVVDWTKMLNPGFLADLVKGL